MPAAKQQQRRRNRRHDHARPHDTIVQTTAPLEQLGRVNSVMGFGNMFAGVAPLAIAPWLAATFGVQRTLVGAGMVVTAVPAALLLLGRWHLDRAARQ